MRRSWATVAKALALTALATAAVLVANFVLLGVADPRDERVGKLSPLGAVTAPVTGAADTVAPPPGGLTGTAGDTGQTSTRTTTQPEEGPGHDHDEGRPDHDEDDD